MNAWQYIKADALFRDLIPEIKNYRRKILGSNTKGVTLSFTEDEVKLIRLAIKKIPNLQHWSYIKADPFFAEFLPDIKNHKYKISGRNSKGNPLDFSDDDKMQIEKGLKKLIARCEVQ